MMKDWTHTIQWPKKVAENVANSYTGTYGCTTYRPKKMQHHEMYNLQTKLAQFTDYKEKGIK